MDKPSTQNDNPMTTAEMMAAYRAEQSQAQDEGKLGWLYLGFVAASFIGLLFFAWLTLDDSDNAGGIGIDPAGESPAEIDTAPTTPASAADAETTVATVAEAEVSTEDVQAEVTALIDGTTILFNPSEATISSGAEVITQVAAAVIDTDLNLRVEGYTDSGGAAEENLVLSQERATTVRALLVEQGIAAERITTEGFGETQAVQDNPTDAQKEADRRIEIIVVES